MGSVPDDSMHKAQKNLGNSNIDDSINQDKLFFEIFYQDGPFALVILDKSFQVIRINHQLAKLTEFTEKELLGKGIFEILHSEDALRIKSIFENRSEKHAPLIVQFLIIKKNLKLLKVDGFIKKFQNNAGENHYCLLIFDKEFCPDPNWVEIKQEVYKAIILTQEQERARIGRSLHDSVAQLLYAIRLNLQHYLLEHKQEAKQIMPIKKMINEAIYQVRNISVDLVPSVLHDFGLKAAIISMTERIELVDFKIKTIISNKVDELDKDIQLAIYRIIQELINNTLKHSAANKVIISIKINQPQIIIEVSDNGIGFEQGYNESISKGTGLRTIKNRTDFYEGDLTIESSNAGSLIRITLNNR